MPSQSRRGLPWSLRTRPHGWNGSSRSEAAPAAVGEVDSAAPAAKARLTQRRSLGSAASSAAATPLAARRAASGGPPPNGFPVVGRAQNARARARGDSAASVGSLLL